MGFELSGWGFLYWIFVMCVPIALVCALVAFFGLSSGRSRTMKTWWIFAISSLIVFAYLGRFMLLANTKLSLTYAGVVVFVEAATYFGYVRKK